MLDVAYSPGARPPDDFEWSFPSLPLPMMDPSRLELSKTLEKLVIFSPIATDCTTATVTVTAVDATTPWNVDVVAAPRPVGRQDQ